MEDKQLLAIVTALVNNQIRTDFNANIRDLASNGKELTEADAELVARETVRETTAAFTADTGLSGWDNIEESFVRFVLSGDESTPIAPKLTLV